MKEALSQFNYRKLRSLFYFLFLPTLVYCQESIRIIDEHKLPLIGVSIDYLNKAEVSDINGDLVISSDLSDTTTFTFRYIGYETLKLSLRKIHNRKNIVRLTPDYLMLEEIVIIGRTDANEVDLPYTIRTLRAEDIFLSNAQTAADALTINGAAYVQKSQMGGGSPILRGFEANKILLVVDGVRMNNAIYRNGHLQNSITIDPAILKRVEILYGPTSLMYGSEALGGVIHFRTKSPQLISNSNLSNTNNLSSYVRYNSSNQEKKIHIDHTFSSKKIGVLTSVTASDFSNLKSGSNRSEKYADFGKRLDFVERIGNTDAVVQNEDPNVQVGTAYQQLDVLQKWVISLRKDLILDLNLQHSTSSDIPRYDNLIVKNDGVFQYAEWYYGPQNRTLISPRLTWKPSSILFDKLLAITSFQNIKEQRVSRFFNNDARETQNENVYVWGLTLDLEKKISETQKLSYGVDVQYNDVNSEAFAENITTNEINDNILSRYPSGGSSMVNYSAYAQHNWRLNDTTLTWINGFRWNQQSINLLFNEDDPVIWPDNFYQGEQHKNFAIAFITGLNYSKNNFFAKFTTGSAFRTPNIDDLSKIRINGNEITVPNIDLEAENVWNTEIALKYRTNKFSIGLSAYYSYLDDAMVRDAFALPDGSTFLITNGDSIFVTANVNAESGSVKGISAQLQINILKNLHYSGAINFQSGTSKNEASETTPLGHIPPTYGSSTLSYKKAKYRIDFRWTFNGWKHIEDYGGSVDNPDLATLDGSPSWQIWGLSTQFKFNKNLSLSLGVDNIFDTFYRPFSTGLNAPGRHIVSTLRYDIN